MRTSIVLHMITIALVLGLSGYIFFGSSTKKTGFVYNQQLFDKFKGTVELKAKFQSREAHYKAILDSIALLIQGGRTDLNAVYQAKAEEFTMLHQQMTEQYTADLWKAINAGVLSYGKEKGYDYILGASGNGSLMYANDANDVTDEVADYLNATYNDKAP